MHKNISTHITKICPTSILSCCVNRISHKKIDSEHVDFKISTKGFIDDIDEVEKKNEERIKKKELEDEHIYWLEEQLVPIIKELSRRT